LKRAEIQMAENDDRKPTEASAWLVSFVVVEAVVLSFLIYHILHSRA
jgi:hypothetical protein